jgi:hypothetical protein
VKRSKPSRKARLAALAQESERLDRERIVQWQRLPPGRRTMFLRKRIGPGRSVL